MNRFGDIDCSFKQLSPVYGFRAEKLLPLEQALQSIESQINELPYFIKIAKKHCHYPNEHALSKDQSAAIYIYAMEWGETTLNRILNRALRSENRQALKIWFPYLKLFDTALDLLPTVKEIVCAGVPLDIGKYLTKNQVFTWWSFSSCSSSIDVIERFLNKQKNSTLFLIEVVNGKKISGYTEFPNEDEIILRFGTQFRVKTNSLKRADGLYTVDLMEIDEEDDNNQQTTHRYYLKANQKWKQNATTIAGGNKKGNQLNQLRNPLGISIEDDQQFMYIVDFRNDRIVKWQFGANNGHMIVTENGKGNRIDQLSEPTDVIVDQTSKSLIICDKENRRVIRWSMENQQDKQIIISDISCYGLTMNGSGDLFVSDHQKHEVRRWRKGEKEGTIVAGGNGRGDQLSQLNCPGYIFIDRNDAIYVSDRWNNRVMKWPKGAKEGIVVAGGQERGNGFEQLSLPQGVIVNEVGDVYVADSDNHRIMCWSSGSKEGRLVVGGNGQGHGSNQLDHPMGLSFDRQNNLIVVDCDNHRIQRFDVDKS